MAEDFLRVIVDPQGPTIEYVYHETHRPIDLADDNPSLIVSSLFMD